MAIPAASEDFYRTLQRLQVVLVAAGRRAWSRIRPDFDPSWEEVQRGLIDVTAATQLAAATAAAEYVPAVLEETGQPDDPAGAIVPAAFAGSAADGRSLLGLLDGAVVAAKLASGRGLAPERALDVGGRWLDMTLPTVVSDAGRQATGAEIAQRSGMGWTRMVNAPCCSRCALLAGRWYRYSAGFPRHPRCDCVHIPAREDTADDFRTDPDELLRRGLITDLTDAQRKALDAGADLGRVVNANRGMYTTTVFGRQVRATTEATTARGVGRELGGLAKRPGERYRRSTVVRLTPEGIYRIAEDQADAVRLLQRYGYITT